MTRIITVAKAALLFTADDELAAVCTPSHVIAA